MNLEVRTRVLERSVHASANLRMHVGKHMCDQRKDGISFPAAAAAAVAVGCLVICPSLLSCRSLEL